MTESDVSAVGFLRRWQDAEPLRLYLYGITVPLLGAALAYGWLSTEQLGAWLAVAGALFVGSTVAGELARRKVASPRTVEHWLEQQHQASWELGVEDTLAAQEPEAGPEPEQPEQEPEEADEPGAHAAPEAEQPEPVAFGQHFHRASDPPGLDPWRQRVPEPELWRQEAPARRRASDPPETQAYSVVRQRCTEVEHGQRCLLERHGDGVPHLYA